MSRRLHRLLALLVVAVVVAGCSGLRVGYRHADTFLAWRTDEYFDLDPLQKQDFEKRLQRLLEWHRYEQLPEYAAFLTAAIDKARPGLKRDDIVWFVDGFAARYRAIVNRGIDDAVDLLITLRPEQLNALQKQWDKDNRKFARERAVNDGPADRKRARMKRYIDQIDDWTGNLTVDQEQKISELLTAIPYIDHLRHQDRIRRQKEFLELLKLRANRTEFKAKLHAWLLDWNTGRAPEYARLEEEVMEKRIALYVAVEKLLTPAQRQHVLQRAQGFVEDFKALSERPRPGQT